MRTTLFSGRVWLATAGLLTACLIPAAAVRASAADTGADGVSAGNGIGAGTSAGDGAGGGPPGQATALPLLDVVMLVDESGSETAGSVAQERQVAATIGQSMLNPDSRITVVGFGGVNNVVPNQSPVDVACTPTTASSPQNLQHLSTCVNALHRRTEREGDDTDYAEALSQAMGYLGPNGSSPPGAIKVILMMTDGGVDVHRDTQQYSQDWLQGERQAVNEQLAAARQNQVQLWTLGMGTDITPSDEQYLQYLARSGGASPCGSTPRSTLVTNRADALTALNQLYAEAACRTGINHSPWIPFGGGIKNGTLRVTIPTFATDAAISVDRGDSRVQVSFTQPDGKQWTNTSAISGQGSEVEVLHLSSPAPGTWTMRLTAPPGLSKQLVSATAFYQGAVKAQITATPPSAQPGQRVNVALSVLGAHGPITDPALVKDLHVGVSVSGDGLAAPLTVPVSNAGESNSAGTGVADYTGSFQAPSASGTLTVTGTAEGYGLYATEVPESVQVGRAAAGFQATVAPPADATVQAGSSIRGHLLFGNSTGAAKRVRVSIGGASNADATLTSPAGTVTAASGNPAPVPFTIAFAPGSPAGTAWLTVKVTDASDPGIVYADQQFDVTVTKPPGFIGRYRWAIIGALIAIAAIVAAALLERARRRYNKDVRPLQAVVRWRDGPERSRRPDQAAWSDVFGFVIRSPGGEDARPDLPHRGEKADYTARRNGRGHVRVTTPEGRVLDIAIGGPGEPLDDDLRLSFTDTRRRGGRTPPPRPPREAPPRSPGPPPPPPSEQPPAPGQPPPPGSDGQPTQPSPETSDPETSSSGTGGDPWLNDPYL